MAAPLLQLLLLLLSYTLSSLAMPLPIELRDDSVLLPSQDPFFQPTQGYESASLGDILNSRQVPVPQAIELLVPGKTQTVWQLQYRSQDDNNQPLAVVTTLFVPKNADPKKLFTQSIAYDSSDINCSPSYTLRSFNSTGPDSIVIAQALNSGWYVQLPDFESMMGAFTNGIISGQTLLDSLRAVKKSSSLTGVSSDPKIGLNGGSGGALACEWALELQPTYAKDVTISGAALGSLTPNVKNVMNTVNKGFAAGLIPSAMTGLARASSPFASYLKDNLLADKAAAFMSAETRCIDANQGNFSFQDITSYFNSPTALDDPVLNELVQKVGVMGTHGTPQAPLYIYKGVQDEISPVADTDALVDKFCNDNIQSLIYVRNNATAHFAESVVGIVGALNWLNDRFNGVAAQPGCNRVSEAKYALSSDEVNQLGSIGAKVVAGLATALISPAKSIVPFLNTLVSS